MDFRGAGRTGRPRQAGAMITLLSPLPKARPESGPHPPARGHTARARWHQDSSLGPEDSIHVLLPPCDKYS